MKMVTLLKMTAPGPLAGKEARLMNNNLLDQCLKDLVALNVGLVVALSVYMMFSV